MSFFDYSKVPTYYQVCFHEQCPRSGECLRFLTAQHIPEKVVTGMAVYPTACHNGQCEFFRSSEKVVLAWGFSQLYTPLKRYFHSIARNDVVTYFGSEGTYYRYYHGERKLSPAQQQDIAGILKKYQYDGPLTFDHYEESYDFGV